MNIGSDTEITNFKTFDPFQDAAQATQVSNGGEKIHLRCQQRNGKKCLTTVQGLSRDLPLKQILKDFKKSFSCNGTQLTDPELGEVIQLTGDQREGVRKYLVEKDITEADSITTHGF